MSDSRDFSESVDAATVPSEHVLVEKTNGNGGGWVSRKFVSSVGSAFGMMAYSGVARAQEWIGETTLITLMIAGLTAIFLYAGINITDKLGGLGNLFAKSSKNLK